jgi:protein YIPF6
MWAGAAVVTLNAQLLGGKVSFFQSVCVLGYCIFPLVLAALLGVVLHNSVVRTILVVVGWIWSTRASVVFMQSLVPLSKRALAVYPVGLFYLVWAWMVFVE